MKQEGFGIEVRGVKKSFGLKKALDDVSLSFKSGVMHGIIGPEGAGKTTLLRVMLGLLKSHSQSVQYFFNGEPVDFEFVREKVAYMPQRQSLYSELSIDEHLDFFKDLYGIKKSEYEEKRAELLAITQLQGFSNRLAGQLSGGMYKKLGLMCALLRTPQIIFLDEPTNGVDPISRREFWELLYQLLDQNILIILTTSYMDEAERCGRVHLLEHGKIFAHGEPKELMSNAQVQSFNELFLMRGAHG